MQIQTKIAGFSPASCLSIEPPYKDGLNIDFMEIPQSFKKNFRRKSSCPISFN